MFGYYLGWIVFGALHLLLLILTMSGEYRKFTIFLHFLLENFYAGHIKFSAFIMMGEVAFLLIFCLYFWFLVLYILRRYGLELTFYEKLFSLFFWVFCVFFFLQQQFYS